MGLRTRVGSGGRFSWETVWPGLGTWVPPANTQWAAQAPSKEDLSFPGTEATRGPSGWHGRKKLQGVSAAACPGPGHAFLDQAEVSGERARRRKAKLRLPLVAEPPELSSRLRELSLSLCFSHFGFCINFILLKTLQDIRESWDILGGLLANLVPRLPASFSIFNQKHWGACFQSGEHPAPSPPAGGCNRPPPVVDRAQELRALGRRGLDVERSECSMSCASNMAAWWVPGSPSVIRKSKTRILLHSLLAVF